MSMEVSGSVELREDIARMADLLRTSGENGSRACSWILQNAAQPVLEQMLHNAPPLIPSAARARCCDRSRSGAW